MERVRETGEKIIKAAAVGAAVLLFAVFFWLFLQGFAFYEDAEFLYSFAKVPERAVLCGLAVLFFVILYPAVGKWLSRCSFRTLRIVEIVLTTGMLAVQCYFLFYVRSYYKWDSGFVIGGAASLAETGSVAEEAFYYLSVYPNQNTFVLITSTLVKLGNLFGIGAGERSLLFNLFNTLCLDASVFLTMKILKKWKRNLQEWELCRIFLMFLCNPFLYLGVSYYYTITLSLPLTMGFLYLLLSIWETESDESGEKSGKIGTEDGEKSGITGTGDGEKRKSGGYGKAVFAGALLGIGYELRATAVIPGIAVIAVGIWRLTAKRKKTDQSGETEQSEETGQSRVTEQGGTTEQSGKEGERGRMAARLAVILLSACMFAAGLNAVQKAYVGIDTEDTAFPTSHWLMMSLTMPGGHNGEDEAYTASFATKEEKKEAVSARMAEKLEAMSASDYLTLVKTKISNTFGTGMNGYPVFLADALRTDGLYEAVFGGHKDFVILWHQGYYLFLLLGILLYILRWGYDCIRKKETDFYGFVLLLILLGAVLFYVLWEASGQYSVPFMMIMEALCFAGLAALKNTAGEDAGERTKMNTETVCSASAYCAFAAAAAVALWGAARYGQFTQTPKEQSHPVAVQILANTSLPVDDGQELVQTLQLTQPFNRLIVQWRNPAQEASTAVYRIQLRECGGAVVFETEIDAAGTGYNGAGIYDFETVDPSWQDYEIAAEKISGMPSDDLEFVVYDMYGYTPYSAGELSLREADKRADEKADKKSNEKQTLTASLLFSVSEETTESYTTPRKYVIFMSLLFLIFLFMGFWCKLRVVSGIREES